MFWFNVHLVIGCFVALFSMYTFIKSYKTINPAEVLFCIALIPLWPIMAYFTVYNYLEYKKAERSKDVPND